MPTETRPVLAEVVEELRAVQEFSLDVETEGETKQIALDPHRGRLKGVSLCAGDLSKTWWLPFRGEGAFSQVDVFRELAPILLDPDKEWINANNKFDYKWWKVNGGEILCKPRCVVVGSWLSGDYYEHGLKEQIEREFGVKMRTFNEAAEAERQGDFFSKASFKDYAQGDTYWARRLYLEKLKPRLIEQDLLGLFQHIEMEIVRDLAEAELHGILIDVEYLAKLNDRIQAEMKAAEDDAVAIVGRKFDIASTQVVSKLLFEERKLEIRDGMQVGKNGFYSTDDEVLKRYGTEPLVKAILRHRKAAMTYKTFVKPYLFRTQGNSRIFTNFKQAGTITGRFTSEDPNLQQIPAEKGLVKRMFIASPGHSFVCGDFNQLQFRLVAHYAMKFCKKSKAAEAYAQGMDLHKKTMLELGFDKSEPDPKLGRRKAKVVNFAFLFGRGAKSFAEAEGYTIEKAKEYHRGFHRTYPEIAKCADMTRVEICEDGYTTSICKRRRRFPDAKGKKPNDKSVWWDGWVAWNARIMGSEADLVRLVMRNIGRAIRKNRLTDPRWNTVTMLIQVHDELVMEAPDEITEDVKKMMEYEASHAMTLAVDIKMDCGISKNWEESKA